MSAEAYDLIDQLAAMAKADGDARPIGQLRAAVLTDLIRRPWDTGRPAVTAHLQVTAALDALEGVSDAPGSVNGLPITAAHVRALLTELGALGLHAPEGGSLTVRSPTPTAGCWPAPLPTGWPGWPAAAAPPTPTATAAARSWTARRRPTPTLPPPPSTPS